MNISSHIKRQKSAIFKEKSLNKKTMMKNIVKSNIIVIIQITTEVLHKVI